MIIAQAYCSHDRSQSIRWQEQIKKWGGLGHHKLFLLRAFDCEPIPEILPFIALTDYLKVTSDWSAGAGNQTNCASGPDSMWRMFARYFHFNELGPFFNCEADCIPLFPDSLDRWEAEYLKVGKPFMGAFVDFPVPHLSGCAHYPENAATYPDLILPHRTHDKKREISFDVAGGRVTLPNAHLTKSMQHVWRAPPFTSQADFDARVSKDALFYHACKDGSIYQFLGGGINGPNNPPVAPLSGKEGDAKCAANAETQDVNTKSQLLNEHPSPPTRQSSGTEKVQAPTVPDLPLPENWRPPKETLDAATHPTLNNSIEIQRARAAKARAVLAAKRATGWKPKRRRRRRGKVKA
jgi:hypothetical protein